MVAGRKDGVVAVVKFRGRLNGDVVPDVAEKVREICGEDRWVVFNLSGVTELVSAGIAYLTMLRDWTRENGGRLVLTECSDSAGEVLRITGLDALFLIMDIESEAIDFLKEEAEGD